MSFQESRLDNSVDFLVVSLTPLFLIILPLPSAGFPELCLMFGCQILHLFPSVARGDSLMMTILAPISHSEACMGNEYGGRNHQWTQDYAYILHPQSIQFKMCIWNRNSCFRCECPMTDMTYTHEGVIINMPITQEASHIYLQQLWSQHSRKLETKRENTITSYIFPNLIPQKKKMHLIG